MKEFTAGVFSSDEAIGLGSSDTVEENARVKLSNEAWAQSGRKREVYDKYGRLTMETEVFSDYSADADVYSYFDSGKLEDHVMLAREPDGDNEAYIETFSESGQLVSFSIHKTENGREWTRILLDEDEPPASKREREAIMQEIDVERKRIEQLN